MITWPRRRKREWWWQRLSVILAQPPQQHDRKKPNNVVGCINGREVSAVSHAVSLGSIIRAPGRRVKPVWAPHLWGSCGLVRGVQGEQWKWLEIGKMRLVWKYWQINYFAQRTPVRGTLSVCKHGTDGCKEDKTCSSLCWTERIRNTWFKLRQDRFPLDMRKNAVAIRIKNSCNILSRRT